MYSVLSVYHDINTEDNTSVFRFASYLFELKALVAQPVYNWQRINNFNWFIWDLLILTVVEMFSSSFQKNHLKYVCITSRISDWKPRHRRPSILFYRRSRVFGVMLDTSVVASIPRLDINVIVNPGTPHNSHLVMKIPALRETHTHREICSWLFMYWQYMNDPPAWNAVNNRLYYHPS